MTISDIKKLRVLVIGFGKIGQGYSKDPAMKKTMRYSTHADVLSVHECFDWLGVVDRDQAALDLAANVWHVREIARDVSSFASRESIEVAVLATPPQFRLDALKELPNLKAVIVEKPLGLNHASALDFVEYCREREILIQVNLLRRVDKLSRCLASSFWEELGEVQSATAFYSNGLLNNGIHIVDLARLFLGEVQAAEVVDGIESFRESPIEGDINVPANLYFQSGLVLNLKPLRLSYYRENGLDLWCERGRLSYLNSGFSVQQFGLKESALRQGEKEIDIDNLFNYKATLGSAFYELYSNLAGALSNGEELYSSAEEALKSTRVVDALFESHETRRRVSLEEVIV